MIKSTLTGKIRFSTIDKGWFGKEKLCLEVEVHEKGWYVDSNGGVIDTVDVDNFQWRDARVEDLQELDIKAEVKS